MKIKTKVRAGEGKPHNHNVTRPAMRPVGLKIKTKVRAGEGKPHNHNVAHPPRSHHHEAQDRAAGTQRQRR